MPLKLLMDAGPLVAYINPRDEHHAWAIETFKHVTSSVITCEAVLAEAFHLVASAPDGQDRLAQLCQPDDMTIDFRLLEQITFIRDLMHKYRNVPMDLADACLVLLAEQHESAAVITTDHDFTIYRTPSRRRIRLIAPFSS